MICVLLLSLCMVSANFSIYCRDTSILSVFGWLVIVEEYHYILWVAFHLPIHHAIWRCFSYVIGHVYHFEIFFLKIVNHSRLHIQWSLYLDRNGISD